MLEIRNATPFQFALVPSLDKEGNDHVSIVVKGTFGITAGQQDLPLAAEQLPVVWGDEFHGEPGVSSIASGADTAPVKVGTDLILRGHACAPRGKTVKMADVTLQLGGLSRVVRVVGDRKWYRSLGSWRATEPEPFQKMPLVYERAFGGWDKSDKAKPGQTHEKRNPVGTGFSSTGVQLEGVPLPNLEDPKAPIKSHEDKPSPACFGFIGRDWAPRVGYAGTYDERWQKERAPLLPDDFDDRFFSSAHPDLIASPHLAGGERVRVVGMSPDGELAFKLPAKSLSISVWIKNKPTTTQAVLDTVVIDPDEKMAILAWRVRVPCLRQFLHIDLVEIKEK